MYLVKLNNGHYLPYDDKDYDLSKKIGEGDVVKATKSRNFKFHKKAFALLNIGYENQDKYEIFEVYRKVIIIRAGFYDEAPTKDGEIYFIPKSLSFENMGAEKFEEWYKSTLNVLSQDMETKPEVIRNEIESFF